MVFVNILSGDSIQGGHLDGWVNEYPDGDDFSQIGGIGLVRNPDGCSELSCAEWHVGYCSESDEQIHALEYEPYLETSIDPRLSYLTWKYGYEFYVANYASGNAIAPMAATQALVWAWHSDPETGSSVFANVAGGLDDPFNWNGLTPSLHTDPSPRVGFHGDDLGATYWTGTDEELLQSATQTVYDLAVEATAKAAPWTLLKVLAPQALSSTVQTDLLRVRSSISKMERLTALMSLPMPTVLLPGLVARQLHTLRVRD